MNVKKEDGNNCRDKKMKRVRNVSFKIIAISLVLIFSIGCGQRYETQGDSILQKEDKENSPIVFVRISYTWYGDIAHGIWMANADGSNQQRLCQGSWPDISPDRKQIVFTIFHPEKFNKRSISIFDIKSKKMIPLKIPGEINDCPVWSPDGKKIAFNHRKEDKWTVGVIDVDGSNFRTLGGEPYHHLPTWYPDGKSIICHDGNYFYRIGLNGRIIQSARAKRYLRLPEGMDLYNTHFISFSKDDRFILFDARDERLHSFIKKHRWEAPFSIFLFDRKKKELNRVTPQNMCALYPRWSYDGKRIIFMGATDEDIISKEFKDGWKPVITYNLYTISSDGTGIKRVIENGAYPSWASKDLVGIERTKRMLSKIEKINNNIYLEQKYEIYERQIAEYEKRIEENHEDVDAQLRLAYAWFHHIGAGSYDAPANILEEIIRDCSDSKAVRFAQDMKFILHASPWKRCYRDKKLEVKERIKDLKSENVASRFCAAERLGELGDKFVIPALIEALNDKNLAVSWAAANSLEKLTGLSFGSFWYNFSEEERKKAIKKWKEWWQLAAS